MTEQPPTTEPVQSSSPIPMIWRIVLGIVAIAVVAALGWQFFANREPTPAEPAAADNTVAPAAPGSAETFFQQGNDLYKSGDLANAVTAYQNAIDIDPNLVKAYANLGAVYYAQQKFDLAEKNYQKAIDLSPTDADLAYNLGAIYVQEALATDPPNQEKLTLAIEKINRAIELKPELPMPYYGLGFALQAKGDIPEAINAFNKFLDLDTGSDPTATQNANTILTKLKAQQ